MFHKLMHFLYYSKIYIIHQFIAYTVHLKYCISISELQSFNASQ